MNKEIKVAKVLSETQLVLNVGSNDGIKEDSRFLVYSIEDEDILDPVTGESLGKLEYVKGRGHVISLQEKMCIIETFKKPDGNKRTIKRNQMGYGLGQVITETEERIPSDELEKFTDVKVGNSAKLI
ncbi:hypothetical protein II898_02435 [bacterium]|nr:hypothetical protein [bacterium]